jgi:hypothetical protein
MGCFARNSPQDSTELPADAPVGLSINPNISRVLALSQLVQTYEPENHSDQRKEPNKGDHCQYRSPLEFRIDARA